MSKLDLKDTYLHITKHPDYRKVISFWEGKLEQLKFPSLHFGLLSVPRAGKNQDLIGAGGYPMTSKDMSGPLLRWPATKDLFRWWRDAYGFVINWEKSLFSPTASLKFLEMQLDTIAMKVLLPPEVVCAIHQEKLLIMHSCHLSLTDSKGSSYHFSRGSCPSLEQRILLKMKSTVRWWWRRIFRWGHPLLSRSG